MSKRSTKPSAKKFGLLDVRVLVEDCQSPGSSKQPNPGTSKGETSASEPSTPQLSLADRSPYARQIFLHKTNVWVIACEEVCPLKLQFPGDCVNRYCEKLYQCYANSPEKRLWHPLHKLEFESRYLQYRFFLALNYSMQNAEEYEAYLEKLRGAGVQECCVDMRLNNVVMEDRDKVVAQLKQGFSNWTGKLAKLPKYLMDLQRHRERKLAKARSATC